ncbi:Rad52/Rad22 family DNA repair protein [Streptacidiphilus sp. PAMC 29251]
MTNPNEKRERSVNLTSQQVAVLTGPLQAQRVQHLRGNSHLEAWDIRRWLIRVFGFGGWSDETLELACISQVEINKGRWTVIYRAQVRLTVKDVNGSVLTHWDDAACGSGQNQPNLADAHDMGMKTALSQALKRCAVNLGDQFGLSLYNDGQTQPVVIRSAAYAAPEAAESLPEDPPVKPEPQSPAEAGDNPAAGGSPAEPEQAGVVPDMAAMAEGEADRAFARSLMEKAAGQVGFADALANQFMSSYGHSIDEGTIAEYHEARGLMLGSVAA